VPGVTSNRAVVTIVAAVVLAAAALGAGFVMGSGRAATGDGAIGRYDRVPGGAYAVVAEVRAKPGKEDELRAATLPPVADVRPEPNNLLYFLHEDRQAPGRFVFYEIFAPGRTSKPTTPPPRASMVRHIARTRRRRREGRARGDSRQRPDGPAVSTGDTQ
jgi:Antibiotic biosynthesis monooxygenase